MSKGVEIYDLPAGIHVFQEIRLLPLRALSSILSLINPSFPGGFEVGPEHLSDPGGIAPEKDMLAVVGSVQRLSED